MQPHQSKVTEVRKWMNSSQQHIKGAQVNEDVGTKEAEVVLCKLTLLPPVKLKMARTLKPTHTKHPADLQSFTADAGTVQERMQEMLSGSSTNRKTKRFKRRDITSTLKGEIPKRQHKFGIDMPISYPDAHSNSRQPSEIAAWTKEEVEEIQTLRNTNTGSAF